jgi:glutathione S-transferase
MRNLKLYFRRSPFVPEEPTDFGTRSMRALWMLEEIGEPFELAKLGFEQARKSPEHLARHPWGRLPVLDTGEGLVYESAAVVLHLADMFPERRLLPPVGTLERGLAYQWAFFLLLEVEMRFAAYNRVKDQAPEAWADARADAEMVATVVDRALADKEYLVDGRFTAVDVIGGHVAKIARHLGLMDGRGNFQAYLERLMERPAHQRAYAVFDDA